MPVGGYRSRYLPCIRATLNVKRYAQAAPPDGGKWYCIRVVRRDSRVTTPMIVTIRASRGREKGEVSHRGYRIIKVYDADDEGSGVLLKL